MANSDRDEATGRDQQDLVTVIVPAFNAERWIDATLRSVRSQSHRALEILVIDDGSTDGTRDVAEGHARADHRVTVLSQPNAGVAAARNLGIERARGRYIAPIDADDLWTSDKIERQLAAMLAGNGRVGLVYCWYARIDEQGRVLDRVSRAQAEGNVIDAICHRNIVGNGSAPLMLREAVIAAGGYDPGLRAMGAEGCEDYKLYFRIAERHDFALVRDFLVGYRALSDSMSQQFDKMIRSRAAVTADFRARYPDKANLLRQGNIRAKRFLLTHSLRWHRFGKSAGILAEMLREDALYSACELWIAAGRAVRLAALKLGRSAGLAERPPFPVADPAIAGARLSQEQEPVPGVDAGGVPLPAFGLSQQA